MIFTPEQWWESEIKHEMYLEEYIIEMWSAILAWDYEY